MSDFAGKFNSFLEGLAKAADSLVKTAFFPPGFDQRDPAYQLAWIDQQIPLQERTVADLEAQALQRPKLPTAIASQQNTNGDWLEQLQEECFRKAQESTEALPLATARERLIELRARRAAIVAALPPAPALPQPKPTDPQKRAQIIAEAAALEAERDKVAPTISDSTFRNAYLNSMNDKIQSLYDSI